MKINARTKGKAGEREAINKVIQPVVDKVTKLLNLEPITIARNLQQSDSGGYDLIGLSWYAFEIKRCEALNLTAWWAQTTRQAAADQVPILLYRKNRMKWRVMMPCFVPTFGGGGEWIKADIELPAFLGWFERDLTRRLKSM